MEKQMLDITTEDAQALASKDYDESIYNVISDDILGKTRWSYQRRLVVQTISDGRFWASVYSIGATESQDESPYEYGKPEFIEVFPVTKTVTVYV